MAAISSEDLPDVISSIEAAIAEDNCEVAALSLHKLKGMLSTFDAGSVALEIQIAVDAARKGNAEEVRIGYQRHKSDIEQLVTEIADLASMLPE